MPNLNYAQLLSCESTSCAAAHELRVKLASDDPEWTTYVDEPLCFVVCNGLARPSIPDDYLEIISTIAYLDDGTYIKVLMNMGVLKLLCALFRGGDAHVRHIIVWCIGNMVCNDPTVGQQVLDLDMVTHMAQMYKGSRSHLVWCLYNIVCSSSPTFAQIGYILPVLETALAHETTRDQAVYMLDMYCRTGGDAALHSVVARPGVVRDLLFYLHDAPDHAVHQYLNVLDSFVVSSDESFTKYVMDRGYYTVLRDMAMSTQSSHRTVFIALHTLSNVAASRSFQFVELILNDRPLLSWCMQHTHPEAKYVVLNLFYGVGFFIRPYIPQMVKIGLPAVFSEDEQFAALQDACLATIASECPELLHHFA